MSTQMESGTLGGPANLAAEKLDKSLGTDLQHLQYTIGVWDGVEGHPVQARQLSEWCWAPNDDYKKLRGILSGHPEHDTTAMKAAERALEEEHDACKFGPSLS